MSENRKQLACLGISAEGTGGMCMPGLQLYTSLGPSPGDCCMLFNPELEGGTSETCEFKADHSDHTKHSTGSAMYRVLFEAHSDRYSLCLADRDGLVLLALHTIRKPCGCVITVLNAPLLCLLSAALHHDTLQSLKKELKAFWVGLF